MGLPKSGVRIPPYTELSILLNGKLPHDGELGQTENLFHVALLTAVVSGIHLASILEMATVSASPPRYFIVETFVVRFDTDYHPFLLNRVYQSPVYGFLRTPNGYLTGAEYS